MKKLKTFIFVFIAVALFSVAFAVSSLAAEAPTIKTFAVEKQGVNAVRLRWTLGREKIDKTVLYKYNKSTKEYTTIMTFKEGETGFKVTSLLPGTDYCFRLRAYTKGDGETLKSAMMTVNTYTLLPKTTGLKLDSNSDSAQELSWNAVKGKPEYMIYYLNKTTGKYVLLGTKSKNYASLKCSPATAYTYKIRARAKVQSGKKTIYGAFSDPLEAVTKSGTVSAISVSAKTDSSVTLKWDAVKKADGYKIYQYDAAEKKYKAVKKLKNATEATIVGLKSAAQYKFKIFSFAAVNGANVYSASSSIITVMTKPAAPTLSQELDALRNGKISLSWTKAPRATGYLIYVSDHKNSGFALYKEVKASSLSAVVSGVKNGVPQYVKIKAYVEKNGVKTYGAYSKVLTVYA